MPGVAGWSLRRRLGTVVLALGSVLVGLVAVAVVLLVQVRTQQRAVINRYFTAVSISNVRFTQQIDAEDAIRGYALTGDAITLQPLSHLQSPAYPMDAERLRSLLPGDRATDAALSTWNTAAAAWYSQWAVPSLAEITARGGNALTNNQVLAGKALFDNNRAKFSAFQTRLVAKRNAASSALKLRTTLLFVVALIVAGALALTGAGSWWALRRWVLLPLSALGAETELVRSGALDHEVAVEGPTELRVLAGDVEQMRRELVDQLAMVERARREIEASRLQLEAQAQDLARSNRDLEQFAYVASHDLQEPLRKVASFCQMLEHRYSGQLDERADTYIAFAVDGAKRMQQLINDLLAFSRVGRTSSALIEVDLNTSLAAARENLSVAIAASGAEVTAAELPRVRGDAGLLTQLFQNLIANSVKFRAAAPPHVSVEVARRGDQWEFSCADNGLGIDAQYAERIFVIFQRLHAKDEYAGTGIGLALCKRIVEYHGGRIWLDPDVAVGTTFRWTLPAVDVGIGDTSTVTTAETM